MKIRLFIITSLSLLAGCQGIPLADIRNQPPIFDASVPVDLSTVATCITNDPDVSSLAGDRFQVMTFPGSKKVEFRIGAVQMGDFKNYYLITLTGMGQQTKVQIRRSKSDFMPLSESQLRKTVADCSTLS